MVKSYIFVGFSLYLIPTILIIPTYCFKLIPYELPGEPNGPIDHGLERYDIN